MPVPLSEMGNLSIINHQQSEWGVPRYSNPAPVQQSYQNWTMIEDVMSCQTALPPGTQGNYMMPQYNSNNIIPAYQQAVCPSQAQQAYMNLANQPMPPQGNMFIPQQMYQGGQSFGQVVNQYNAYAQPQYQTTLYSPPFAGSVPALMNAKAQDVSIVGGNEGAREGYAPPPSQETCLECLKHVNDCGLCQKINNCNTGKYWTIIIILIAIIIMLVMYIFSNKNSAGGGMRAFRGKY